MELDSVRNEFRFSSGKMLVSLEKRKLLKPEFIREISEFICSENRKVFDWQHKHIYGKRCFFISRYYSLLRLVQILWIISWQDVQETWCCFAFTFLLQSSQNTFVTVDIILKWLMAYICILKYEADLKYLRQ